MVVSGSFGLFQILVKLQLGSGYVRDGFVIFDKKFLVKITFSDRFGVGSGGFGWFRWFRWFRGVEIHLYSPVPEKKSRTIEWMDRISDLILFYNSIMIKKS